MIFESRFESVVSYKFPVGVRLGLINPAHLPGRCVRGRRRRGWAGSRRWSCHGRRRRRCRRRSAPRGTSSWRKVRSRMALWWPDQWTKVHWTTVSQSTRTSEVIGYPISGEKDSRIGNLNRRQFKVPRLTKHDWRAWEGSRQRRRRRRKGASSINFRTKKVTENSTDNTRWKTNIMDRRWLWQTQSLGNSKSCNPKIWESQNVCTNSKFWWFSKWDFGRFFRR